MECMHLEKGDTPGRSSSSPGPGVREGLYFPGPSFIWPPPRSPPIPGGRAGDPLKISGGRRVRRCQGRGAWEPCTGAPAASAAGELPPCARLSAGTGEGGRLPVLLPGAPPESRSGGGGAGSELPPAAAATVAGVTRRGEHRWGVSRAATRWTGQLRGRAGAGVAASSPWERRSYFQAAGVPVARCQGARVLQDSGNLLRPGP